MTIAVPPLLERLVYRSSASGPDLRSDMDAILQTSVWNNARYRITGALGRLGSNYVQVLEGPTPALGELLSRLQCDERHSGLTILRREPVPFRLFPGWSMARVDLMQRSDVTAAHLRDAVMLISVLSNMYQRGETAVA